MDDVINLDAVYTSESEAIAEIRKRYANVALKNKVLDWVGHDVLLQIPFIFHEPVALLFRCVATPNFETIRFIELAEKVQLTPIIFEYLDDKFTDNNFAKYSLGKCYSEYGVNKNGDPVTRHHTIIDFTKANGRVIRDVQTISGDSLVSFHHQLFLKKYPHLEHSLFDGSATLAYLGDRADLYYKKFLALSLCFGCLYETFLPNDPRERVFIQNIFMTAFTDVQKEFGIKPLIIKLLPNEHELEKHWEYYNDADFSVDK